MVQVEAPIEPTFYSRQDEARNELLCTYNREQDKLQSEVKLIKEELEDVKDLLNSAHYIDKFIKQKVLENYENQISFRLDCYEELERKIEALTEF